MRNAAGEAVRFVHGGRQDGGGLHRLTPEQRRRFHRVVLEAFVPDLHTGLFQPGLHKAREFADSGTGVGGNPHAHQPLELPGTRVRSCKAVGCLLVE
ncbi:hypothetical protein [Streptomyces sp. NPDC088246]|uniref:hypothetical protein n=1 Tax=Streptomyces sp. NPDC088246 TaxID=3365842 RepID=UPI00382690E9